MRLHKDDGSMHDKGKLDRQAFIRRCQGHIQIYLNSLKSHGIVHPIMMVCILLDFDMVYICQLGCTAYFPLSDMIEKSVLRPSRGWWSKRKRTYEPEHNETYRIMYAQRRVRSACAPTHSDQNIYLRWVLGSD